MKTDENYTKNRGKRPLKFIFLGYNFIRRKKKVNLKCVWGEGWTLRLVFFTLYPLYFNVI